MSRSPVRIGSSGAAVQRSNPARDRAAPGLPRGIYDELAAHHRMGRHTMVSWATGPGRAGVAWSCRVPCVRTGSGRARVGRPRYARVLGNPNEKRELGTVGNVKKAMMRLYGRDAPAPRRAYADCVGPRYGQSPEGVGEAIDDAPARFLLPPGSRSGRWRPASPTDGCPAMARPSRRLAFRRAFPTHRVTSKRCPADVRSHHGHWISERSGAVSSHSSEGSVPGR